MEHISDIELVEYVAGRLPRYRYDEVREHIKTCVLCDCKWRETASTWDVLGKWQIVAPDRRAIDIVKALSSKERLFGRRNQGSYLCLRRVLGVGLRVAASIIIGITFGHLAGKWSVGTQEPGTAVSNEAPAYVGALGLRWSTGIVQSVLDESPVENEGNSHETN